MSEAAGPFYLREGIDRSDIMGPNGVVYSCISTPEAKSHVACFNHAWSAAGGPALQAEVVLLREALDEMLSLVGAQSNMLMHYRLGSRPIESVLNECNKQDAIVAKARAALSPAKENADGR